MSDSQIPDALNPNLPAAPVGQAPISVGEVPVVAPNGTRKLDQIPLFDHKNKSVVMVHQDDLQAYLSNPQYTAQKGSTINMFSPDGELGSVPAEQVHEALQNGYTPETFQQSHDRKLQDQYGGPVNVVDAALTGVARGASLGLSDVLETKLGTATPEQLANLKEANPTASALGDIAGMVGSLATGRGFAAGAEAVGKGAERVLARQAAKAGLSSGVAKALVEKIAPKVAGSAVEGAFFGTGELLSEDALGKADLNAQNLAYYAGTGALINGAFGGAFATAGAGAEALAPYAKKAAEPVVSLFQKKISTELSDHVAAGRLFGLTPTQMAKLKEKSPKVADDMVNYLKNDLKLGLSDTAEALATKNEAMQDVAGKKIGSILNELDTVLVDHPELRPSKQAVFGNMLKRITDEVYEPLSKSIGPESGKIVKNVEEFANSLHKLSKEAGDFKASDLQVLKKAEDKLMTYTKDVTKWTEQDQMRWIVRDSLKKEIDLLAHGLQSRGLAGDLGSQLQSANRQFANAATFGPYLEKRALKAGDHSWNLTDAAKTAGFDLLRKVTVLGKIEQGGQVVKQAINGIITSMKPVAAAARAVPTALVPKLTESALARDYSRSQAAQKPRTQQQAYANIVSNVQSFQASPDQFMNRVNRQTSSIYGAAPQTSAQLDALAVTAMAYMSSKLPKQNSQPTLLDGYRPPRLPSSQELTKFSRIVQAVEQPATVMNHIKQGVATREEVDVLKNVYPAIFANMQQQIIAELPKIQATIPYNKRLQLGLLMDVPTDRSMQPQNVLGLQSQFNNQGQGSEEAEDSGAIKPTSGGMEELDKSGRTSLNTQDLVENGAGETA